MLAASLKRSPDTATVADLRSFQLHLVDTGTLVFIKDLAGVNCLAATQTQGCKFAGRRRSDSTAGSSGCAGSRVDFAHTSWGVRVNTQPLLDQLAHIVDDFTTQASKSAHRDLSDLPHDEVQALITRATAAVQRIGGRHSSYACEIERVQSNNSAYLHRQLQPVIGVVKALFHDMKNGYLHSVIDLVHAETFGDFLEMAQHLLDNGYKDAAAVITGSSLEVHLRALCVKHGIDLEVTKQDGSKAAKNAETVNADLAGRHAYTKNDQKSVTAWLGLRNSAAHGKYTEYEKEQVALLIEGVRQFIARA